MRATSLEDQILYIKLGSIGRVTNGIKMGPKPMRLILRGVFLHPTLDLLAETFTDLWLDLLVQKNFVDNGVSTNAEKKLMLDSDEIVPLKLTIENIKI